MKLPKFRDAAAALAHGDALARQGDLAGAEAAFRRAIELDRRNPLAFALLGDMQRRQGDAEAAVRNYRAAIKLDDRQAAFHHNLARSLEMMRQPGEAIAAYRRALELQPDHVAAHTNLGILLDATGKHPEAVRHLTEAARLDPQNIVRRRNLRLVRSKSVPQWHFRMMNDEVRNAAWDRAIRAAVRPGMHVLDIGTGSGLLAMMAARAGAAHVTSCEVAGLVAEAARDIVAANGFAERVTVVAKHSSALVVGEDMPRRADLLVSEILSSEVLGEGAIPSIAHAFAMLLQPGAASIPRRATAVAALVGGPGLGRHFAAEHAAGFEIAAFNRLAAPLQPLDLSRYRFEALSEEATVLQVAFPPRPGTDGAPGAFSVEFTVTRSGRCYGVAQWMRVELDESEVFVNDPRIDSGGEPSGWEHLLYTFETPVDVIAGQRVRVRAENTGDKLILGEPEIGAG
jgi:Flp pilus assembly protein TadD